MLFKSEAQMITVEGAFFGNIYLTDKYLIFESVNSKIS